MADRSACSIQLFGVAGHEMDLFLLFEDWDEDWGFRLDGTDSIVDGVTMTDQEILISTLQPQFGGHITERLEELGVSHLGIQSAYGEYMPLVVMWTPDLGRFESVSDEDGEPVIHASVLEKLMQQSVSEGGQSLIAYLNDVTGKAHRHAFRNLSTAASEQRESSNHGQ